MLKDGTDDLCTASYSLSRGTIARTRQPGMATWRKALFVVLADNASDPLVYFGRPPSWTATMDGTFNL